VTNTLYLEELIKDAGLKKSFFAEKCGITLQTFTNKMTNKSEFTASEIKIISDILKLTPKQIKIIFFADDVHTELDKGD